MAKKNILRVICAVLVICFAVCGLSACGGSDQSKDTVKVTIDDGGKKTEVEIAAGKTVADALSEAKITLGDQDTCEPKSDVTITADTKTITVKRAEKATEAPTEAPTEKPTEAPTEKPTEKATEAATEAQADDNEEQEQAPEDNGEEENADYGYEDAGAGEDDGGADEDDGGVYEVRREAMPDCDGSGHGYYIITYSDGSTGTEEY